MLNTPAQITIIVITYNRPQDMLDLVQNISGLAQASTLLHEIIIVNNCSTESYLEVEAYIHQHPGIPFRYFVAPSNLGVSGGRNFAIQKSNAPILVFLDDDALFKNNDALLNIPDILNTKEEEGRITGITAFKVFYHSTGEVQENAFPHKQFNRYKHLHHFQTSYFIGCAHAIRKELFDKVGLYPESFFYGMEEYDLSYRALNAGYGIVYDDRVIIDHKESPTGRLPNKTKLRGMWVNKSTVAWKYLPGIYFLTTALLWSFEYLRKSNFHLPGWWSGWRQIVRIPRTGRKSLISKKSMNYLQKVKARLWY